MKNYWLVENRIILVVTGETITEEELLAWSNDTIQMFATQSTASINILFDIRKTNQIPALTKLIQLRLNQYTTKSWLVMVRIENNMIKFLANIAGQIVGRQMYFAPDMRQGARIFAKY